ncbi:MAG: alpha-2-macroglobulin family protein [Helicobacteraceae bacterium]|nr:alpha-2-macroglobulin family protein [Helicobacteraceae bacterium]
MRKIAVIIAGVIVVAVAAFLLASRFPLGGGSAVSTENASADSPMTSKTYVYSAADFADKPFTILDVSEMAIDGAAAIVITFSTPLLDNQKFDDFITVYVNKRVEEAASWELSPNKKELRLKYVEPEIEYNIKIEDSKIKNIAQKSLTGQSTPLFFNIVTRELQPSVGFASKASLLPSDLSEGLPVSAVNINKINVDFFRVDRKNLPQFIRLLYGENKTESYYLDKRSAESELVYTGGFDLGIRKNTRETVTLPIKDIPQLSEPGVYYAVLSRSGRYNDYMLPVTLFSITDIGAIAHVPHGGGNIEIFTQSLLNGRATGGVKIELLGENGDPIGSGETDKDGHLALAYHSNAIALLAEKDGKTSFVVLDRGALDLGEFAIAGKPALARTLFAFGPRDLYRSGEKVYVNALLRDADGKPLDNRPIKVTIIQGDNKIAKTFTWQGIDGFYQYEYQLASNAPTGDWFFKFDLGYESEQTYQFKVEDFMPEKMALEIITKDVPIIGKEDAAFDLYGKYLYGAPAAGNVLVGEIVKRPLREAVKSLPGFYFGSVRNKERSGSLDDIETSLNREGKARIIVNNKWSSIDSPLNIVFTASLMESGGRPVTRTAVQPFWPKETLPAIKPNFGRKDIYDYRYDRYEQTFAVDYDSSAEFEIIYTNKDGERLENKNLQVNLIRKRRDYYWYSGDEGWNYDYREREITLESRTIAVEKGLSAKVSFDVEWGPYVVEVVDRDGGAVSSVHFWAGWSWQESGGISGTRPEQIKLRIDKPSYKAGDIAKVTVESPESGSGYLFVEYNGGLLWWQAIEVEKEGSAFDIPVPAEWNTHDIYVGAAVIRGGSKKTHATPKRTLGLLHLPLDRSDRKLDFALNIPSSVQPKSKTRVGLKINLSEAQKGKEIYAIVSAVDSGILNITNFVTPDPFEGFFAKRAFNVDMFDIYGSLIESKGRNAKMRFGGDIALDKTGRQPLTKIQMVAMQSKPIKLNENGEAEVVFEIPDFNGELRFMAQVWSGEDFASFEQKVVVAAPFVVELNHPRFLAGGDNSMFALDLSNMSGVNQNVQVRVKAEGLLSLTGKAAQSVQVSDKQKRVIYIPITAKYGYGEGVVIIEVLGAKDQNGNELEIERKWDISVRHPYPAETFKLVKQLSKGETLSKEDINSTLNRLEPSTVQAVLNITAFPPLHIAYAIRELFAYPYGCVEQTTSGIYPSIYYTTEQLTELGIQTSTNEDRKANVNKGIARLLNMQKSNGSFGFWSADSSEAYWASVYVTDFLLRAKEQGFEVPQAALTKAIWRLQDYLAGSSSSFNTYSDDIVRLSFSIKSYAAFVLAREQKASLAELRRLYENVNSKSPELGRLQLAIALKLMGDVAKANDLLSQLSFSIDGGRDSDYYWYGDYGTPFRDRGYALSLMYEYDLLEDRRLEILTSISGEIRTKNYFSTQERNAIALLGRHFLGDEPDWEAQINSANGQASFQNAQKAVSRIYDFNGINAWQNVLNSGSRSIFATLEIVGYPVVAPKEVKNKGFVISREYYTTGGDKTTLGSIKSGELVVVVLRIGTDLRRINDALVVDLLPAGLELENQNLGTSSVSLENTEVPKNKKLARAVEATRIIHQEFRDDRYVAALDLDKDNGATIVYLARAVSPGSYAVPPPFVESMYSPQFYAIGAGGDTLIVK